MLKLLAIMGGAALVLRHLKCRLELPETGLLYRTKDTMSLPTCQRCGRKVRRPLVVLRDDESDAQAYVGPHCAAIMLRTQEALPDRATEPEPDVSGSRPSCCDVAYEKWKNDHPIDYQTARSSLHLKQAQDRERGRHWNVTHAMTLAAIGRNKRRRWHECRRTCDQRMYRGNADLPPIRVEVHGDDEVDIQTDPPMTARRQGGAWVLVDRRGLTLSTHPTRDAALREAQSLADTPF